MIAPATSPPRPSNGSLTWDLERFGTSDTDKASPSSVLLAERTSRRQEPSPKPLKQLPPSCSRSRSISQLLLPPNGRTQPLAQSQPTGEVHQNPALLRMLDPLATLSLAAPRKVDEPQGKRLAAKNSSISKPNCWTVERSETLKSLSDEKKLSL